MRGAGRPGANGRGYVLRRLIRRTLTTLWRQDSFRTLADLPGDLFGDTLEQFGQPPAARRVRETCSPRSAASARSWNAAGRCCPGRGSPARSAGTTTATCTTPTACRVY